MNEHNREALKAYYAEAATWNDDRIDALRVSNRRAWWVAGIAATIAVLQAIALLLLTPLKTVEPYTLMVDRTTGYVQALKPLDPAKIAPDAALTQSFLSQYVVAREGFDFATLNADYRKAALFSAERARTDYLQTMQIGNPQSPLNLYPRSTVIDVQVKSVSPIGSNAAMVRFDTVRKDANGGEQPAFPWVAVIRFRYSTAPMSLEDRLVNPLGFQVISYRKNPEVAPAPVPAAAPTSATIPSGAYYTAPPANSGAPR